MLHLPNSYSRNIQASIATGTISADTESIKMLPALRPNAGIQAAYRKKLQALIDEMARSYAHWLRAQYRRTPPLMALDALPARELQRLLRDIGLQWSARFDEAAPKLAEFFAQSVRRQTERRLKEILRDAGITVRYTEAMWRTRIAQGTIKDVMTATVAENVSLIRSIPQQFHTQVEGLVMRSVTAGRDLASLTDELQDRFAITRKRAKFIALDQNNKASSALRRERETSLGITEGVWLHSHAGKEPRPTHLRNDGRRFNLREGWYDPDPKVRRNIWPGELIQCRCTWRAVVKGFS